MADIAVISSIYDGMNLVAKEYAASQVDEKGVLLLSEFAGASDELEGAILVNPYDIESFSEAMKTALIMPQGEKKIRMEMVRRQIKENDIYRWISNILHEMSAMSSVKQERDSYLFDHRDDLADGIKNKKLFLFLDYDGTLTPIVESPDKAVISGSMRSLIIGLKKYIPVAVISGRSLDDIKKMVGIEDIIYAGNHGAEVWDGEKTIIGHLSPVSDYLLKEFIDKMKTALSDIQGIFIEDKGITASIHFRKVNVKHLSRLFDLFYKIAGDYKDDFRIVAGKKVLEIRPVDVWDKGDAVKWITEEMGAGMTPVYIGDDVTDEDAFCALIGKGISISIGVSPESDYYLKNQGEVNTFLKWLLRQFEKYHP